MRTDASRPEQLLAELVTLLASDQLPVQEEIARASGVHQSLVSRARNGQLKRVTRKVLALHDYARSRVGAERDAAAAAQEIDADAEVASLASTSRSDGPPPRGTGRRDRRGADRAGDGYRRQARDGVESYLNEGYDPRLIVEQLAVLRRAQRLRRPGRVPIGMDDPVG